MCAVNLNPDVGILSYGTYIPQFRIRVDDIADVWNAKANAIKNGLGLVEKSVPGLDEDTITIAVNAALQARIRQINPTEISAIYTGSESHPYSVKSSSMIVAEALGVGTKLMAADLEFACKAGTAAMQIVYSMIKSNLVESSLAIGADTAQGAPGDALEYSAAAGGAAYILGREKVIAKIIHTISFASETPDFWRREHEKFPKHAGRFTGEPAYFKHITGAFNEILKSTNLKITDFAHVVFHMPNGKFPMAAAKMLKINEAQMKAGFVVTELGNTYSACSLIGLASALDNAKPGEKILLVSYGSGAGSDAFVFEITEEIVKYRKNLAKLEFDLNVEQQLARKKYLNYGQYLRHTGKIDK